MSDMSEKALIVLHNYFANCEKCLSAVVEGIPLTEECQQSVLRSDVTINQQPHF